MAKTRSVYNYSLEFGKIQIPLTVSIALIEGVPKLKAGVSLEYAGLYVNDIRIVEDFTGNLIVAFPAKEFIDRKTKQTKQSKTAFPSKDLSSILVGAIIQAYTDAVMINGPMATLLSKSIEEIKSKDNKKGKQREPKESKDVDAAEVENKTSKKTKKGSLNT